MEELIACHVSCPWVGHLEDLGHAVTPVSWLWANGRGDEGMGMGAGNPKRGFTEVYPLEIL